MRRERGGERGGRGEGEERGGRASLNLLIGIYSHQEIFLDLHGLCHTPGNSLPLSPPFLKLLQKSNSATQTPNLLTKCDLYFVSMQ